MRCRPVSGSAFTSSMAPSRGGSMSALSNAPSAATASGEVANRLAVAKLARAGESVGGGVLAGAPDQRRVAFDADDLGAAPGDRQREISQPAEKVGDALAGLRVEQRDGAPHQHTIHLGIHLREVARVELEAHVEIGQRIGESRRRFAERMHARRAARLQPEIDAMQACEGGELALIVGE